jgi:DNA-binding NarL/FixJ family response regulator
MATPCPGSRDRESARAWERRVFKNTYVRDGQTKEVRGWAVRLQLQGTRKTFSLSPVARRAAAAEARQIHYTLLTQGWDAAMNLHRSLRLPEALPASANARNASKDQPLYWNQRLMRRKYTEHVQSDARGALSVRIGDETNQFWFPLGTESEADAARRALEIYRALQSEGWPSVCGKYPREITIAIFWVVNPVAVTYTTVHTIVGGIRELRPPETAATTPQPCRRVAVIEPDPSIQMALKFWLDRQPGIRCVLTAERMGNVLEANGAAGRPELLLFNRALPPAATTALMQTLKERLPDLPVFAYAISEDIDQIFISLSGVKAGYIFRRRIPGELLEPVRGALSAEKFSVKHVAHHVRNYFSNLFESGGPIGGSPRIANLTAREGEILNLLSKGCVDKEIAEALRISVWTVHTHLRKIYEKLQVHTRTEAVVKYLGK